MNEQFKGLTAYQAACACDRQGLEAEAIPHYQRALDLGLATNDRRGALLGLGSSLRNVGRFDEAVGLLEDAVAEFPGYPALSCFLALAYRSAGRHPEALTVLLEVCLQQVDLDGYAPALEQYRPELEASDNAARVRGLYEAMEARNWTAAEAFFSPTAVMTWWTSGERFEGAAGIIRVNAIYPEGWSLQIAQLEPLADGRLHCALRVTHAPQVFFANSIFSFVDGLITSLDEWWATAEEPPEWRSTETIPGYHRFVI